MRINFKLGPFVAATLVLASCDPEKTASDAKLRRYVATGDTNSLAMCLRTKTNANRIVWCGPRRDDFASLLHVAVEAGQLDSLKLLLATGADADQKDSQGRSPLMWTVGLTQNNVTLSSREQTLSLLLKGGANPNLQDTNGQTPLIWASSFGRMTLAKLLLDAGAGVRVKDGHGNTALHLAENREVATLLLNARADINATNIDGETPVAMAVRDRRLDVLSVLTNFPGWSGR